MESSHDERLSARDAEELLRRSSEAFSTPDQLCELAGPVGIDAPGRVTVLYGGLTDQGIWSRRVVSGMRAVERSVA